MKTLDFEVPIAPGWTWHNWAETKSCRPRRFFKPRNEAEIIEVLQLAVTDGVKVKAVGAGHSPNAIACTDGYMVSLANMNRVLSVDRESGLVTVEGGATFEQLNECLSRDYGLALPILGSISAQSVAGAIATATHGTGMKFGCIATNITSFRIVLADGSARVATEQNHPDLFAAGLCGLGALGIITQITMKCPPAFNLRSRTSFMSFQSMLSTYKSHVTSADHVAFYWYPHTDKVMLVKHTRCQDPIEPAPARPWLSAFIGTALETTLYIARFLPLLNGVLNRVWATVAYHATTAEETVDQSYKVFNFDCHFRQHVAEWAIPIDRLPVVMSELKRWIDNNQWVHFPIEIRFVQKDHIWLSTNYDQDTCHIGIIMYKPFGAAVPYRRYFEATQALMVANEGRPHWAKAFSCSLRYFHRVYPKLSGFLTLAHTLDPKALFWHPWHDRIFGPIDTL